MNQDVYLIRDAMKYANHVVQVGTLGGSLNDPRNPMFVRITGELCNMHEWINSDDWKSWARQKIESASCGYFGPPT